jgi:membrane-associated phospholipid phosphatase
MRIISIAISWIFLPLFMPVLALLIVFYTPSFSTYCFEEHCLFNLPDGYKTGTIVLFSVLTIIAPGVSLIFLKSQGVIESVELETAKERNVPIVIMLLYAVGLYSFLWYKNDISSFPSYFFALTLSGILVTSVFFVLNRWQKISIHAGGVGILVGFVLAYMLRHGNLPVWPLVSCLVIAGLVMSARLYLEKHSMIQIVVGWCTGLFITFITTMLY